MPFWHTGPGQAQVRVAVAWREEAAAGESYLRLWGPDAGALQEWEADPFTQTAAVVRAAIASTRGSSAFRMATPPSAAAGRASTSSPLAWAMSTR